MCRSPSTPVSVTGFLGPNGAGKSTTMRMIVGLDRPSAGRVTIDGTPYAGHRAPLHEVGALLEARSVHPGRTAYSHLRALGATHGIGARRVREVISLAGLDKVAHKRVGGFSLGMGQRLGIATALLGDPHTIMLDEPVNGLDPEGVLWVRTLARQLAAEGRTVFLSSHLMSEMAKTADHVIVLGRGKVIADAPIQDVIDRASLGTVRVRTPEADTLSRLLQAANVTVNPAGARRPRGRWSPERGHRPDRSLRRDRPASADLIGVLARGRLPATDRRRGGVPLRCTRRTLPHGGPLCWFARHHPRRDRADHGRRTAMTTLAESPNRTSPLSHRHRPRRAGSPSPARPRRSGSSSARCAPPSGRWS